MTEIRHGLPATYRRHRCRCGPCRYAAARQRAQAVPLADPEPVRAHILALSESGIGYRRTAELAGVTMGTVWRILRCGVRPKPATAAAILAVRLAAPPDRRTEPLLPTARRLQALRAIGWSVGEIAGRLGLTVHAASRMSLGRRVGGVRRSSATAVRALYAELSEVFPPMSPAESRNRTDARQRGWFPPIAWDVETIDDPDALPCLLPPVSPVDRDLELLVQHVVAGHPVEATLDARREIVRRMPDHKPRDIAALARCTPRYVSALRQQLERAC